MAGLAYVAVKGNQGKFGIHKIKTNRARLMKYYDHWKAKAKLSAKLEKKTAKILKKYPAKIEKQKAVLNQLFAKHKIPQKVNGQVSVAVPEKAGFRLKWEISKYNKLTKVFRRAKLSQKTIQKVNEKNHRIKQKISKKMTGRIVGYSTNVMRFFLKYGGIAALGTAFYVLWNDKNDKVILEVAPEHIPMIEEWISSLSEEIAITQIKLNTLEREDIILKQQNMIEAYE
jgi:Fe2+ transport system protein B